MAASIVAGKSGRAMRSEDWSSPALPNPVAFHVLKPLDVLGVRVRPKCLGLIQRTDHSAYEKLGNVPTVSVQDSPSKEAIGISEIGIVSAEPGAGLDDR